MRVVTEKRDRVFDTITVFLAAHPESKPLHPICKLRVYPVSRTPFVVLYDFDEHELRVHLICHSRADLTEIDPAEALW